MRERAGAFSRERQCSNNKELQPIKNKIQVTVTGAVFWMGKALCICSGESWWGQEPQSEDAHVPHRAHWLLERRKGASGKVGISSLESLLNA